MRESGVLMHISSLASPGPIGTLGASAFAFVDFLCKAGARVWQVLPIGPIGYGASPYQSASTYAGNPLWIDLGDTADATPRVDYAKAAADKTARLREAFQARTPSDEDAMRAFAQNEPWVHDYALFMALKEHFGGVAWTAWPDKSIRDRRPDAIRRYTQMLGEDIAYHIFTQTLFFQQWYALKRYANERGVALFGDMPIYVAEDSADTWVHRRLFLLDRDGRPTQVAGVPPDYFSADGQKWGNPLYRWPLMACTRYQWWIDRLRHAFQLYDRLRVDHFIGFANYYAIPACAPNARTGAWKIGPGMRLFRRVQKTLGAVAIVAEDLGVVSNRVKRLLRDSGYPGMRVLQFALDDDEQGAFYPPNYPAHTVAYTGTHDNDTSLGWWNHASEQQRMNARRLIDIDPNADVAWQMIASVMKSRANTAIIPMQDILSLDSDCRMNTPGTVHSDNWAWRLLPGQLTDALAERIRALNTATDRS